MHGTAGEPHHMAVRTQKALVSSPCDSGRLLLPLALGVLADNVSPPSFFVKPQVGPVTNQGQQWQSRCTHLLCQAPRPQEAKTTTLKGMITVDQKLKECRSKAYQIWGKTFLGRRSPHSHPEARACLMCSRNNRDASVAGSQCRGQSSGR